MPLNKKENKENKDKSIKKKPTNNSLFNGDLDKLFERFIAQKDRSLKSAENFRKEFLKKIDLQINELYKKRDFIAEIFARKSELRREKVGIWKSIWQNSFWTIIKRTISIPFIYGMSIFMVLFHIALELYHQVCFRLYGIPLVKAKDYFIFDRRLLPHLNWLEKFNCAYCSYYNNLIGYAREIGARTERYWCPIKHSIARKDAHSHYGKFIDYSDGEALRKEWDGLRKFEDNNK